MKVQGWLRREGSGRARGGLYTRVDTENVRVDSLGSVCKCG